MSVTTPPEISRASFDEEVLGFEELNYQYQFNGRNFPIEFCQFSWEELTEKMRMGHFQTLKTLQEFRIARQEFLDKMQKHFFDRVDYLYRWLYVNYDKGHCSLEFNTDINGMTEVFYLIRWSETEFSGFKTLKQYT